MFVCFERKGRLNMCWMSLRSLDRDDTAWLLVVIGAGGVLVVVGTSALLAA